MQIELILDPRRLRRWHLRLAERIAERSGAAPAIRHAMADGPEDPPGFALLLALERLLFRLSGERLCDPVTPADLPGRPAEGTPDLVVDLSGGVSADPSPRSLVLTCSGLPADAGAIAAVLARKPPLLALGPAAEAAHPSRTWRVALERPESALLSLEAIFGRMIGLVLSALADEPDASPSAPLPPDAPTRADGPFAFLARTLSDKVTARLAALAGRAPRWSVAWRPAQPYRSGLPDLAAASFRRIAEDGRRFLADPFLFAKDGRTMLFVEEFPFATGRGILSAAEMGPAGPGPFRPVLDLDCHLSYPFLFEHAGETWMIPETSARRTVEFYAATDFPFGFEQRHVIADVDLADATLVERNGLLFLLGTARFGEDASSWDALRILVADRLEGPWRPVGAADAPLLVDSGWTRPAGRVLAGNGRLVRPVQDCRAGYGSALGFAEITHLDRGGFAQTPVARFRAADPARGLHHYDTAAGLEVVDVFGPVAGDAPVAVAPAPAV